MTCHGTLRGALLGAVVAALAFPAWAEEAGPLTTADEVRAEIAEAMEAIAEYSEQERDQALTRAREALNQLDAEIARREQALRENWSEMSETARDNARARLEELREARNRLGERYGALQAGARSAWDELRTGFSDAWNAFSKAWRAADEDMSEE
ncbi:MAG: hypothetical protein H5U22_25715 [Rhizobium sp.]|nr:hypothetical protein [Rhizobium sp.]